MPLAPVNQQQLQIQHLQLSQKTQWIPSRLWIHVNKICSSNFAEGTCTFQDSSIAGLDSQRSDIGYDLWAGFEDDQQNTNRAADSLEGQTIVKESSQCHFANYCICVSVYPNQYKCYAYQD